MAYEYYFREFDKNTRFILACFFIVFILLLNVIQRQNSHSPNHTILLHEFVDDKKVTYKDITNKCLQYALDCKYIVIDNNLTVRVITNDFMYSDPFLSDSLILSSNLYKIFNQDVINTYYSFGIKEL